MLLTHQCHLMDTTEIHASLTMVAFTPFSLTKGTFQSAKERDPVVIIGDSLEFSLPVSKGKLLVNVVANIH